MRLLYELSDLFCLIRLPKCILAPFKLVHRSLANVALVKFNRARLQQYASDSK